MKYDLHIHTFYSDGLYSPSKVIDNATKIGLSGIAITDHDSVLGIEEAVVYSKQLDNFNIIPGIELSCIYDREEVHILGYFIDYNDKDILDVTKQLREHRVDRCKKIIERLSDLNIKIDINNIQREDDTDFVGRVAIARELIAKGYVSNIQEGFNKYLNPGKPAYVERYKLSIEDAISLIKNAGGIPVLAHPGLLKNPSIIEYCIKMGIEGLESIHSKHSPRQVNNFKNIAYKNDLISTGGSDCHGEVNNGELLIGKYFIDLNSIPIMKERIK